MTFSKEHQIGACWFDAFSIAKVALLLSFMQVIFNYLGSYFQCLELIMLVSRIKLMPSGGKGSNLG